MPWGSALRNLDFKGIFTYEQAGQTTTRQWVHLVRNGVEHERLLGLDGAHREVLRERPAGCLMRGAQGIQSHLSSVLAGEGVTSLQDYYALSMGEQEVVAGAQHKWCRSWRVMHSATAIDCWWIATHSSSWEQTCWMLKVA